MDIYGYIFSTRNSLVFSVHIIISLNTAVLLQFSTIFITRSFVLSFVRSLFYKFYIFLTKFRCVFYSVYHYTFVSTFIEISCCDAFVESLCKFINGTIFTFYHEFSSQFSNGFSIVNIPVKLAVSPFPYFTAVSWVYQF